MDFLEVLVKGLAIAMRTRKQDASFFIVLFLLSYVCIIIPSLFIWIRKTFGAVDLEAIIFMASSPLEGVSDDSIEKFLRKFRQAIPPAAIISIVLLILNNISQKKGRDFSLHILLGLTISCVCGTFYCLSALKPIQYLRNSAMDSQFFEENYSNVQANDITGSAPKNLIIIMLESMENTFADDSLFEVKLTPELEALQQNGCTFKSQYSVIGETWTIASLTSYLFGVPLKLPIDGNKYNKFRSDFLPNANSVLDILSKNQYAFYFFSGCNSVFSGYKNLIQSHTRDAKIFDSTFYFNMYGEDALDDYRIYWGLTDNFLLEEVKKTLPSLVKSDEKFFVLISTINTHSKGIVGDSQFKHFGDDRDSFIESSKLVSSFHHWLTLQPFFEDTVVVLLGDHPYMSDDLGKVVLPPRGERTIYNCFLNSGKKNPSDKRLFSGIDIAPTLLEAIGFTLPEGKFGLGTSLFSGKKTLLEQYGLATYTDEIQKNSKYYNNFFDKGNR